MRNFNLSDFDKKYMLTEVKIQSLQELLGMKAIVNLTYLKHKMFSRDIGTP